MTVPASVLLLAVFLFTAFISVVTGGTSLITVPAMMQLGVDSHVALATDMLTLIFLSLGGTVPFLKGLLIPRNRLLLGALLLVVAGAMIVVALFSLTKGEACVNSVSTPLVTAAVRVGFGRTFTVLALALKTLAHDLRR